MKIKKAALGIFIIVSIIMITIILFETKRTSFIYADFGVKIPTNYALMGIDVSHHQGEINFKEAVRMTENGDSLEFVYIKATEGTDFCDRNFDENAAGFEIGRAHV
jgi:lysozyme